MDSADTPFLAMRSNPDTVGDLPRQPPNDPSKSCSILARGAPEAEIQLRKRPARKSLKLDDLSESGRMLAQKPLRPEVIENSRSERVWPHARQRRPKS